MRIINWLGTALCVVIASAACSLAQSISQPERLALARAHAELFGDPATYLAPAVFDAWSDVFRGRSPFGMLVAESAFVAISGCAGGECPPLAAQLCLETLDPDHDGTNEFRAGDVVGPTNDYRPEASHVITAIDTAPPEQQCSPGTALVTLYPPIDTAMEPAAGAVLRDLWNNPFHASAAGYYLIGSMLANTPRLHDGLTGPPLTWLDHGSISADADSFAARGAECSEVSWSPAASALQLRCIEGAGRSACHTVRATRRKAHLLSRISTSLQAGHRYLITGVACSKALAPLRVEMVTRRREQWIRLPFTASRIQSQPGKATDCRFPALFAHDFIASKSVARARLQVTWEPNLNDPAAELFIDSITVRELPMATRTQSSPLLINDPNDRMIVVTGDSWTTSNYIEQGLEAALMKRLHRDLSSQVISTGKGGFTAESVLAHFDEMIGSYQPLYAVISVGVNEAYLRRSPEAFVTGIRALAARCQLEGIIPIFIGVPPVGGDEGPDSLLETAYRLRDAERAAFLDVIPAD